MGRIIRSDAARAKWRFLSFRVPRESLCDKLRTAIQLKFVSTYSHSVVSFFLSIIFLFSQFEVFLSRNIGAVIFVLRLATEKRISFGKSKFRKRNRLRFTKKDYILQLI